MNALQHFQRAVCLPPEFGLERPYARLVYVDESGLAGADADVEYLEQDGDDNLVVVTITEWQLVEGKTQRGGRRVVTFDAQSGEILRPVIDQQEDLAELLAAVNGMGLVKDEGASE